MLMPINVFNAQWNAPIAHQFLVVTNVLPLTTMTMEPAFPVELTAQDALTTPPVSSALMDIMSSMEHA